MNRSVETSRYTSIVVVAKRARQLIDGSDPVIEGNATKPVTVAIKELEAGKLKWKQKKSL